MAKAPSSVIGIDIGQYSLKSVLLQRRGKDRIALTHYGSFVPTESARTAEELGKQLKGLLRDMGGRAKTCSLSISSAEVMVRIIEQPETPPEILRDALRLNGMALLNQDVKGFVLDCDHIPSERRQFEEAGVRKEKYLVGGLPRDDVKLVGAAADAAGISVSRFQISAISVFNAFEFSKPEVFNGSLFFLVDIGHSCSTLLVGSKRELVLVRSIDFGGKALMESLIGLTGTGREGIMEALEHEDEVVIEYTRVALAVLTREIASSIGFVEHQHDQAVTHIYFSGGPSRSKAFLKLISEELKIPCEAWAAAQSCEIAIAQGRKEDFEKEMMDLNVACGAAIEVLNAK